MAYISLNNLVNKILVMESAIINSVFMRWIAICCLLIFSLTIKNFISMCLLRLLLLLFLEKKTASKLSQKILNGFIIESVIFKSDIKFFNHNAYNVASQHAMNSTSIVDDDGIIVCFILLQDAAPSASKKMYPEVDFFVFMHPAKSKSKYLTTFGQSEYLYISLEYLVPCKYLITFLAAFECSIPGLLWYLPNIPTACLVLGLLQIYAYIRLSTAEA